MAEPIILEKFGYKYGRNGAHSARSIMSEELKTIFSSLDIESTQEQYQVEICDYNLLDKPTTKARLLTYRHLVDLYGMRNDIPLFRVFRRLWLSDPEGQSLLAFQLALVRDPLLRLSIQKICNLEIGSILLRTDIEEILKAPDPDRFSAASLKSFAQNINGSWTQAGFLQGRNKKVRSEPKVTPVNVAFALFLSYLEGATGQRLFHNPWCKLFGIKEPSLIELTIAASHRGILDFKQSGGVIEVRFPGFLTVDEEQWLYE
mgnify:CR=1 FL=1